MPGIPNQLFLWFFDLFHIPIHTKQRKTRKDNRKGENRIDLCITEPFPKNSRYKEEAIDSYERSKENQEGNGLLPKLKGNRIKKT